MRDELTKTVHAILGVTACAFCGALLPRRPEDDADPVVKALGRICDDCYAAQEEGR